MRSTMPLTLAPQDPREADYARVLVQRYRLEQALKGMVQLVAVIDSTHDEDHSDDRRFEAAVAVLASLRMEP